MPSYSSQPPGDAGAARCWLGQNEITKFSACKIPQNFELGFWDALSPCTSQPPLVGGTLGPWKSEIGHVGSQRLISTVHAKCAMGTDGFSCMYVQEMVKWLLFSADQIVHPSMKYFRTWWEFSFDPRSLVVGPFKCFPTGGEFAYGFCSLPMGPWLRDPCREASMVLEIRRLL